MSSAFISDIRQFATPAAFAAYLAALPTPDWPGANPIGSTVHNTYRPLPSQWVGRASMDGMVETYIGKGWDRGPHYYFCIGAPNPAHDGIWQMTPPGIPGIHAGDCNAHRFGIENVGDFQATTPSAAQQALIVEGLAVLHTWAHLGADIVAHRDCMAGRTCPGQHLYDLMPTLKTRLAAQLHQAGPYRVHHTQAIFEAPAPNSTVASHDQAEVHPGDTVIIDEVAHGGWAHLANGLGFVPIGILEKL